MAVKWKIGDYTTCRKLIENVDSEGWVYVKLSRNSWYWMHPDTYKKAKNVAKLTPVKPLKPVKEKDTRKYLILYKYRGTDCFEETTGLEAAKKRAGYLEENGGGMKLRIIEVTNEIKRKVTWE